MRPNEAAAVILFCLTWMLGMVAFTSNRRRAEKTLIVMLILLGAGFVLILVGCVDNCPSKGYQCHLPYVAHYDVDGSNHYRTPGGILVVADDRAFQQNPNLLAEIDQKIQETEACLGQSANRDWFGVHVVPNWYISACSGQELFPCRISFLACERKGIEIPGPDRCKYEVVPTDQCPCVCSCRYSTQDGYWINTVPNLIVMQTGLIRLMTGIRDPYGGPEEIARCAP